MTNFGSLKEKLNSPFFSLEGGNRSIFATIHVCIVAPNKVVSSNHRPNAVVGQSSEHCYQK